jgi:methylaspartate mutase sigma subunit
MAANPLERNSGQGIREGSGGLSSPRKRTVVSTVSSDSHTWNLVFLQKYLQERGHEVINLGPCVPDELLVEQCVRAAPDLVVISSVNGHGRVDGLRVIRKLRERPELADTSIVIGGKLGINGRQSKHELQALQEAGFDAIFDDNVGADDLTEFIESPTQSPNEIEGNSQ